VAADLLKELPKPIGALDDERLQGGDRDRRVRLGLGNRRPREVPPTAFALLDRVQDRQVGILPALKMITLMPGLAGVAVLNPDLVRLAAHYRFSPGTTERQDPESNGKVEAIVRFTKSDLIPYEGFGSLDEAIQAGAARCQEVNAEVHYEACARPVERLEIERPAVSRVARVASGGRVQ
jgi:hypothetical protein